VPPPIKMQLKSGLTQEGNQQNPKGNLGGLGGGGHCKKHIAFEQGTQ